MAIRLCIRVEQAGQPIPRDAKAALAAHLRAWFEREGIYEDAVGATVDG